MVTAAEFQQLLESLGVTVKSSTEPNTLLARGFHCMKVGTIITAGQDPLAAQAQYRQMAATIHSSALSIWNLSLETDTPGVVIDANGMEVPPQPNAQFFTATWFVSPAN